MNGIDNRGHFVNKHIFNCGRFLIVLKTKSYSKNNPGKPNCFLLLLQFEIVAT